MEAGEGFKTLTGWQLHHVCNPGVYLGDVWVRNTGEHSHLRGMGHSLNGLVKGGIEQGKLGSGNIKREIGRSKLEQGKVHQRMQSREGRAGRVEQGNYNR